MKKIAFILGTVFLILTFLGSSYVFMNHGQVNAGYGVIPALWTIICFRIYKKKKCDE